MNYNLSINKLKEIDLENNIKLRYYNFRIDSDNCVYVNFFFKVLVNNDQILFDIDKNSKLINELVKFKDLLADNLSCRFIFYDNDNLLRYINYNNSNQTFCVGILIEELTFDVNLAISDTSKNQFCEEINEFLNNRR
jgi:hypothetical protein